VQFFIQKYRLFKSLTISDSNSLLFLDKKTKIQISPSSKIILENGILKIGGTHPRSFGMPSLNKTFFCMDEGSQVIVKGDVYISSGSYIHIRQGGKLVLMGKNYFGNDNKIIVNNETQIGKGVSTSWNVTLMEDDGHSLFYHTGKQVKKLKKKMIFEDNVVIQMNVTIPRGIRIGTNSLIGANSVIRNDIPPNAIVYTDNVLRIKHGFSAGLQFT
jgi:acetyltransferase-like isoleucine patch superfamily enzyme